MDFRSWAVLSAVFAGLTAVVSKRGLEGVPSNLALTIRVVFVLVVAAVVAGASGELKQIELTGRQIGILALSALATGASWLCYFKALSLGPVSGVAPIDKLSFVVALALGVLVLKEKVSANTLAGSALIVAGVLVTLTGKQ